MCATKDIVFQINHGPPVLSQSTTVSSSGNLDFLKMYIDQHWNMLNDEDSLFGEVITWSGNMWLWLACKIPLIMWGVI